MKFPFDVLAYVYREGIDRLEEGFSAAIGGLQDRRDQLSAELGDYEAHLEAGGEVQGEWDEDNGGWLYRADDLLRLRMDEAETTLRDLRHAYIVMIYHHWERSMQRRLDKRPKNHAELVKCLEAKGCLLDERLAGLHLLVGVLKHDKDDAGRLCSGWPFLPERSREKPPKGWPRTLHLSDQHVLEALDIVRLSGPPPAS